MREMMMRILLLVCSAVPGRSVNISDKTSKRGAPEPASGGAKKSKVAPTKKIPSVGNKRVNFLHSDKWEKNAED